MIDIAILRENPTLVKENMKKKFQDDKIGLVDEAYKLDKDYREVLTKASELRSKRNKLSKEIGQFMREGNKDAAENNKKQVSAMADELAKLEDLETQYGSELKAIMMKIPNFIDESVPLGKDDSENVEITKYGEPVVPDFEIPYHTEIMENFDGIDMDAAGRVAGQGFYYLMGDIARLHSAILSYARDFMIDRGFTYVIPPYMIRSNVVTGVMSFEEMDSMMYKIEGDPNFIDESVPLGKDDSENVEITKYGEPVVPDFEIPYHTEIMENFDGIDMDAAGRVAGQGFYYLMGDIARLHSAILSYARDFMIDRGFTYVIPPYMIRSNVVTGVMSFEEMDSMMYKIEGEDLYLIGTSEHSMIGKFIDNILEEDKLPYTYTSYSPCFRKEKGAHGIEERGVYRIHQFEKQEMIVVCKPEDSKMWFEKLWNNTVDLFRSLDIPVRTLECCSGDLADLKSKSIDVEAWSPRQKKYFEVGSCSNLTDAQARRLNIRINGENGKYFAHTLNNTVVAPPRMLIAFLENNLNEDGSVNIPKALQPYMGGKEKITK